jgi:hypothetical protein
MGQLAVPMMIGAAVGGGSKLLQGKGLGGILKGAALGGAMGGATGGLMGAAGGTAGAAGGTGTASLGNATEGLLSASGLPSFADVGGLSSISQGGSAMGALNNAALAEGTTGLASGLIPTMNLANSTPVISPSMLDTIKQYGTIDNLQGAAQVASMYQPQPLQSAPTGRIEIGQAPTGAIYDELRKLGYTMPKRRETNFSLLG